MKCQFMCNMIITKLIAHNIVFELFYLFGVSDLGSEIDIGKRLRLKLSTLFKLFEHIRFREKKIFDHK